MALADLYRFGQGVTKNESEAYALFEQAADLVLWRAKLEANREFTNELNEQIKAMRM